MEGVLWLWKTSDPTDFCGGRQEALGSLGWVLLGPSGVLLSQLCTEQEPWACPTFRSALLLDFAPSLSPEPLSKVD